MIEKPMFFQVLVPGFSERLEIPTAFVKYITPQKIATIWSPLGGEWSIKIQGCKPHLYFGEGWDRFAQAHGLEVGYFLVFCYEGDMVFSVIVLDTSSCRKEYTLLGKGGGALCDRVCEGCQSIKLSSIDNHTETGNGNRKCEKVVKEWYTSEKDKVLRNMKHVEDVESDVIEKELQIDRHIVADTATRGTKHIKGQDKRVDENRQDAIHYKKIKYKTVDALYHVEKGFKGKEMKKRADNAIEDTTKAKKRKHVNNLTRDNTEDTDKTVDVVKYTVKKNGRKEEGKNLDNSPPRVRLSADQEDHDKREINNEMIPCNATSVVKQCFLERKIKAKANDFKDTLNTKNGYFEMGKENTHPCNVTKGSLEREIHSGDGKILKNNVRKGLMDRALNKRTDCPSDIDNVKEPATYRVTLKPCNLQGHYYLYIPVQFKKEIGISENDELVLKDPKGDIWHVEVLHSTKNRTLLVRGWKELCLSNKLKAGDQCEFQLSPESERSKKLVQVHVFRKSKEERLAAVRVRRTSGVNLAGKPSFWNILKERSIKSSILEIPNAFVAATNIREKPHATLRDEKGCLFTVNLMHATRNRAMISKGWKNFCYVNKLKPGDICKFELDNDANGNNLFQVQMLQKPPNPDV